MEKHSWDWKTIKKRGKHGVSYIVTSLALDFLENKRKTKWAIASGPSPGDSLARRTSRWVLQMERESRSVVTAADTQTRRVASCGHGWEP